MGRRFVAVGSFTMRHLAVILIAMLAVACTKADEHKANAAMSDANVKIEKAADKTGDVLKKGYEKAKPSLKEAGHAAGEGLKSAGKDLKASVHNATAPSDGDAAASR